MFGLGEYPDFVSYEDTTGGITLQFETVKALIMPCYPEVGTKYRLFDYDTAESFVKEKNKKWYE